MELRQKRPNSAPAGIKQSPPRKDASCPTPSLPAPPPKPLVPVRTKHVDSSYRPRPDATSHYPFTDTKATAESVLSATAPAPSIYSIGAPQRKRRAARAFAEACTSSAGLRVADVPETLSTLGIHLPRDLERAFLLRSLAAVDEAPEGQLRADPVISLPQWLALVDRYVDRERRLAASRQKQRGDDLLHLGALLPSSLAQPEPLDEDAIVAALLSLEPSDQDLELSGAAAAAASADEGDIDLAKAVPGRGRDHAWPLGEEAPQTDHDEGFPEQPAAGPGAAAYGVAFHAALGRSLMQAREKMATRAEQTKAAAADLAPQQFESARHRQLRKQMYGTAPRRQDLTRKTLIVRTNHAHRLRQVQSRIGADVYRDRRRHAQHRELETTNAFVRIAEQRLSELGLEGLDSEGYDPSLSGANPILGPGRAASSRGSDPRGRYADLDSGSASNAIADAFLRSSVGRQLVPDKLSLETYSLREMSRQQELSAADADQLDAEYGGAVDEAVQREVGFLLGSDPSSASASASGSGGGHKTVRERYLETQVHKDAAKEVYKGWREAKGGYAADFGAPKSRFSDWQKGPIER